MREMTEKWATYMCSWIDKLQFVCFVSQNDTQLMLDPAKPNDGNQPGYQTICINLRNTSEVDALPCGILLGRLHHGSTDQVSVADSLFCLLPMWWVNGIQTASYKEEPSAPGRAHSLNILPEEACEEYFCTFSLLVHHTVTL